MIESDFSMEHTKAANTWKLQTNKKKIINITDLCFMSELRSFTIFFAVQ